MIIPEYWAEARRQYRGRDKQITVRRFGWSDESQLAAQSLADARVDEALRRAQHDPKVVRREPKVPYNGAEGVPIREEIIARHERYVITRNSYGALCLNTPDVLFADVDFPEPSYYLATALMACNFVGLLVSLALGSPLGMIVGAIVFVIYCVLRSTAIARPVTERSVVRTLARIERAALQFPDWALRIYRTPAGFRILVTHQTFNPHAPEVSQFFRAFAVDALYARMCHNQHCFRARLTAKPWRIGIADHMRPRPGVWPVTPDRMADRSAWIDRYQQTATSFAACAYVRTLGGHHIHSNVEPVVEIHDNLSQAHTALTLA